MKEAFEIIGKLVDLQTAYIEEAKYINEMDGNEITAYERGQAHQMRVCADDISKLLENLPADVKRALKEDVDRQKALLNAIFNG
jgi:hypothetical protein